MAVINYTEVEAVAIFSPTNTHDAIIQKTEQRRENIFCEKPIDFELKRVEKVDTAIHEVDVRFMLDFNRRFDAEFTKVKQ
ncbi:MAG: Gfo/Idh/MocA family oxidoreductase [Flavobacteriales bacterium AspAUS03]